MPARKYPGSKQCQWLSADDAIRVNIMRVTGFFDVWQGAIGFKQWAFGVTTGFE
jgi:hypothetical protein